MCQLHFRTEADKMKLIFIVIYSIVVLLNVVTCESSGKDKNLIVEVPYGKLKGKDNGYYFSYESIPYAEPPVGDLRFEAPQPYQGKWLEVFDATVQANRCMQWNPFQEGEYKITGLEDCLTVNIYKPKTRKGKYPVLIYIHGGAFMFGSPSDNSPDLVMNSGNVILVTIHYRLGPLGFLSTEDESITGNFGLKDQQLALQWIKENIAHFGGDPDKMLLFGFSAGAASSHLQMMQPSLKHKVKAVISLSGVALSPWVILKNSLENTKKVAKLLQCPNLTNTEQLKHCLQNKLAEDIVETVGEFLNYGNNPFTTFGPVVEHINAKNAFITEHPIEIIKSGNYSHLPWLAAYAAQDGCYNAAELLQNDPKTGKQLVENLNQKWLKLIPQNLFLKNINDQPLEYAKQLKKKYLGDLAFSEENYFKVQDLYTDILFKNGVQESIKLHSVHTKAPVYGYVFNSPAEYNTGDILSNRSDIEFGTCHGDDFTLILSDPTITLSPDQQVVSHKLLKMFELLVESGEMKYDDCTFANNAGNTDQIESLLIFKDKCENIISYGSG